MRIAFLGLGRMGRHLAAHLITAGHEVIVWNRTAAATEPLVRAGATAASTPAEAVAGCPVVVTMLFGPDQVRAVVTDAGLPMEPDALWIDATTIAPADADQFMAWADRAGVRFVHAPVTGSTPLAETGQLGVLLGGPTLADLAQAAEVVAAWAAPDRVLRFPSAGQAAAAKLVANVGVAVGFQGVLEAVRLGRATGLDLDQTLGVLGGGPLAGLVALKGDNLRHGEFPTEFSVDLLAKDITLMLRASGAPLPALTAVLGELHTAARDGDGDDDFTAISKPELTRKAHR